MNRFRENLEMYILGNFGTVWTELWTKREFSQNRALRQFKLLHYIGLVKSFLSIKRGLFIENVEEICTPRTYPVTEIDASCSESGKIT